MTQRPIVSVDVFPDLSTMTVSTLESLSNQAFIQLEDGPVVEGLLGFYLSVQTELEDRQSPAAQPHGNHRQSSAQPVPV